MFENTKKNWLLNTKATEKQLYNTAYRILANATDKNIFTNISNSSLVMNNKELNNTE